MVVATTLDINTFRPNIRLTGEEYYPMVGRSLPREDVDEVFKLYKGLFRQGNCLRKACILKNYLMKKYGSEQGYQVVIGGLMVVCFKASSSYGHAYNPPLEYHAWVYGIRERATIDFALPGVIERGLKARDEKGPFLLDMRPEVLAAGLSRMPGYLRYQPAKVYRGDGREEWAAN